MEVIRKKMQALKEKLEQAEYEAQQAEEDLFSINEHADEKEELVQSLLQDLANLEDELDGQEDRLNDVKSKYNEAVKQADENERAHKELSNRGQIDNSRVDMLQNEIDEINAINDRIVADNQDVDIKLEECEKLLEDEEDRFSAADLRVKELEVDAVQTGNLLRSMEINEGNAAKSHSNSSTKLEHMKQSLKEITSHAEFKEDKAQDLEQRQVELDDELSLAKERYQQVKADYDGLLAEVAEI